MMMQESYSVNTNSHKDTLVFGTDGWRDVIGDKFTARNLKRAAQAYADYLRAQGTPRVLVGYDTRFNGSMFAEVVAQVLAANNLDVQLASSYIPTPMLSFATKQLGAGGAVMLTASHNPPPYLGFKLKGPYGGTATSDIYEAVDTRTQALDDSNVQSFDTNNHHYEQLDAKDAYFEALAKLVDIDALQGLTGKFVYDAMGGAGCGYLADFFERYGISLELTPLRNTADPMFYGVNPEPLPQNLASTTAYMADKGRDALFAAVTDGDADRIGVVLPGGAFFNSHQIFAVLLDMLSNKGLSGRVVKTVTTSRIVERLAEKRGLDVVETPVGFKYIVGEMLKGDVLIGGEESGGIGVHGHIPERDGLANTLLLLECVAKTGKGLAELFRDIEQETGWKHAYDRLDLHLSGNDLKNAVLKSLESPPESIASREVMSVERRDGVKLNLSDNAWVLFRASGTEPVLRIYCEAASSSEVSTILGAANTFVQSHA
ncbi:MAG: phosphoglucomutase/phosphomannomutase family protein [Deinococcota bacterium]